MLLTPALRLTHDRLCRAGVDARQCTHHTPQRVSVAAAAMAADPEGDEAKAAPLPASDLAAALHRMTYFASLKFHDFDFVDVRACPCTWLCLCSRVLTVWRVVRVWQLVAFGDNGAVFQAVCTKEGMLLGETFAFKAVFNTGATNTAGDGFRQYEREFVLLSELPRHRNVMQFYAQFTRPVPAEWLKKLPEDVRDMLMKDRHSKKPLPKPLPCQWAVFEWLPETVTAFLERESGGAAHPPWQLVVSAALDVGRALEHLWRHGVVRGVAGSGRVWGCTVVWWAAVDCMRHSLTTNVRACHSTRRCTWT